MKKPPISSSMEDYLKAIFELGESNIKTQDLATGLNVSSASVTGMLKKLSELKLVLYELEFAELFEHAGNARRADVQLGCKVLRFDVALPELEDGF